MKFIIISMILCMVMLSLFDGTQGMCCLWVIEMYMMFVLLTVNVQVKVEQKCAQ